MKNKKNNNNKKKKAKNPITDEMVEKFLPTVSVRQIQERILYYHISKQKHNKWIQKQKERAERNK